MDVANVDIIQEQPQSDRPINVNHFKADSSDNYYQRVSLESLNKQISKCGPYQLVVYLMTLWPQLCSGLVLLQNVFILAPPNYRCHLPSCEVADKAPFRSNLTDKWIRWDDGTDLDYSCSRFAGHRIGSCLTPPMTNHTEACLDGYVYDYDDFIHSAASEWNLVCDQRWKKVLSSAIFMSGMLFAILCGWLADKYGRRSVFLWAPGLSIICGIIASKMEGIWWYTLFSFFMSFSAYGMVIADFTIGMETVETKWRILAGNGYPAAFAAGQSLMALIFYLTQDWRYGLILICLIHCTVPLLTVILPESISWQISSGNDEEELMARKEIEKAARMNKIDLNQTEEVIAPSANAYQEEQEVKTASTIAMFKRHPWWVFAMSLGWFVSALTYYGLTFKTAGITKSLSFYWSFVILAWVEVPFVFLMTFLMKWMGRKSLFISTMLTTGILSLVTVFLPPHVALWSAVVAKGVISMTFNLVYPYTSEIFPTNIRTTGLSFCSGFARIGTIMSPVIGDLSAKTTYAIVGGLAVVSAFTGFILPETKGHELPEDFEDLDKLTKRKSS